MASKPDTADLLPRATPIPQSTLKGKRKRGMTADQIPSRFHKVVRQGGPSNKNSDSCGFVSNDVISCYPTADASDVFQNQFTRFVWNIYLPQFSQTNLVDVYLFHGDSDLQVGFWPNLTYPQGHLSVLVNDTWWEPDGSNLSPGHNSTETFYFVMVRNGANRLSQPPQSTFTATQTALPNSILSSQSSVSAASASSEAAMASSLASASSSRSSAAAATALQSPGANGNFPHWAIALLAVFGFLAFIAVLVVFWLLIRNLRSRNSNVRRRNSAGSESPMMANMDPQAQSNAAAGSSYAHGELQSPDSPLAPLPVISNRHNIVSSDGASTVSRADSAGGPISAVDAAAMATAFRNVMRKPDFADRPMEEGESPEDEIDVLNRELAEEGRDIRSVSSSRGVKVETLSDSGDAVR